MAEFWFSDRVGEVIAFDASRDRIVIDVPDITNLVVEQVNRDLHLRAAGDRVILSNVGLNQLTTAHLKFRGRPGSSR